MADEFSVTINTRFQKGTVNESFQSGQLNFDVAGNQYIKIMQNIGTVSPEVLDTHALPTVLFMVVKNSSATAVIDLRESAGANPLITMAPGEICAFPPSIPIPYALADVAGGLIEIFAVEDTA